MLLAVIVSVICLSMPVGYYSPKGMGLDNTLMNLCIQPAQGTLDFATCPLFIILLVSGVISVLTIFAYKNRKLQVLLCNIIMTLNVGWYIVYAVFATVKVPEEMTFRPALAAAFPLVAIILTLMARRGVVADEKLVRAADRIR